MLAANHAAGLTQGPRHEAEPGDEQDQHDQDVVEAGGANVDLHARQDAGEDDHGAADGQQPAERGLPIIEKQSDADEERNQVVLLI